MKKKKNYIFPHMSVKVWGGGRQVRVLADMSAKNLKTLKVFLF